MIPHLSERGLILAPRGRDAEVAAAMLADAKVRSVICLSVDELVDHNRLGGDRTIHPGDRLRVRVGGTVTGGM